MEEFMADTIAQKTKETKEVNDKERNEKTKALEIALTQIEKQFGEGSIMRLGESDKRSRGIATISTGALSLDLGLGIGGFPRGRIVEIYGPESSGKTTLALSVVANAQKAGGSVAYIDAEHAIDPKYAQIIGVNLEDMLISQPDCGEDAMSIAEVLTRSNAVDVIVVDSVAALVPKAELDGEIGDKHVGLQARLMSQSLRKLTAAVNKSKTCLIFINQLREKIGVMFGSPETTTGGRALKFYASIRIDLRRIATLNDNKGESFGSRISAKVVKNKMSPPFRKVEFDILWNRGISRAGSILDVGIEKEVVSKRGAWFSYKEERLGQGKEQARDLIDSNQKLQDQILKDIYQKINNPES